MRSERTLVLCDNLLLFPGLLRVSEKLELPGVTFACSPGSAVRRSPDPRLQAARSVDVRTGWQELAREWQLLISVHCRQIFPPELVRAARCVNFHPGYNPHNRGWFPHVFSILNGRPAGITLHEMDEKIDHGPVIYREEFVIRPEETSGDVYARLIARELELFEEYLPRLIRGEYQAVPLAEPGSYNSKADFERLKQIELDEVMTAGEFLNRLRALTFEPYRNAFFVDPQTGRRYYVQVKIEPDLPES